MPDAWREFGWSYGPYGDVRVFKLAGLPEVTWPSGRVTTETFAAVTVMSATEAAAAHDHGLLEQVKLSSVRHSARTFIAETERLGFWVRTRRNGRRRARRFTAINWTPEPMTGYLLG